ncbi:MAG: DUF1289 domain-containing protein [Casimicrobiaceae bacterium]
MTAPITSPCIKVCVMDDAVGLCAGCGRTLDEIARWGMMSAEERGEIMAALPERWAQAFGDAPPSAAPAARNTPEAPPLSAGSRPETPSPSSASRSRR